MGKKDKNTKNDAQPTIENSSKEAEARELVERHTDQRTALDERSVYVSIVKRGLGLQRRIDTAEVYAPEEGAEGVDPEVLNIFKNLFDPKELRPVERVQNRVAVWLSTYAFRSRFRAGVYRIPLGLVKPWVEFIAGVSQELVEAVEENLVTRYEEIKTAAMIQQGPLYREEEFPVVAHLRAAFRFEWCFVALKVPGALSVIGQDLYESEASKVLQRARSEEELVRGTLRQRYYELVSHMVDILQPGEDGKPRRFREGTLEKIREFERIFPDCNLTADKKLEGLVTQASSFLEGVDAGTLKANPDLMAATQMAFAAVQVAMADMVEAKSTRAVKLEE